MLVNDKTHVVQAKVGGSHVLFGSQKELDIIKKSLVERKDVKSVEFEPGPYLVVKTVGLQGMKRNQRKRYRKKWGI
jgi:hypothetical protein